MKIDFHRTPEGITISFLEMTQSAALNLCYSLTSYSCVVDDDIKTKLCGAILGIEDQELLQAIQDHK